MAGGECYGRDRHRAITLSLDREKQSLVGSVGAYAGIDCEGATTGRYRDKKNCSVQLAACGLRWMPPENRFLRGDDASWVTERQPLGY
jgi:hypothetical protein